MCVTIVYDKAIDMSNEYIRKHNVKKMVKRIQPI